MNEKYNVNLPVELPHDLLYKYRKIDEEFMSGLYQTNPTKAFELWENLYLEVLKSQPEGKRYHKGGEVHNMGICKLFLMSPIDSMNYFILGYIEDVLSTITESGSLPENAPGAQNLKNIFKLNNDQLRIIKQYVEKTVSEIGVIQDPNIILTKLGKNGVKRSMEKAARDFHPTLDKERYSISCIPGVWENRVFIGGDYLNYFYVLNMVKPLVLGFKKYTPILAYEFSKPEEMSIREHALLLLHNCKYAIFDISGRGGHLMEIERTFDYQTKANYICLDGQQPSGMLDHLKDKVLYFKEIDKDLPLKVNEILSSFE